MPATTTSRAAADTLIGGPDVDLFGTAREYDHDTVRGFQPDRNQIDIYRRGPGNFSELQSHIEKHGADTWLHFGKDVLILKGINQNVLTADNFIYDY